MQTLGAEKSTKITKENSYWLTHSFSCSATLLKGVMVKLNADGTVSAVTAVTDLPIGFVTRGNGNHSTTKKVTVLTPFIAFTNGVASGAVTTAKELSAEGLNTDGEQKWKVSTDDDIVSAVALSTVATGKEVSVGILGQPYKKKADD